MSETIIRPAVPASGRVTPASFPFYTTGEDNLRIVSFNAAGGVRLKLNARVVGNDQKASPQVWDHTPNTDRSAAMNDFALSGLTLLNLSVFASAGAPRIGQTFVIVQLIRGVGAAAIVLGTILQGYVTTTQAVAWPGSPIETSIEGGGVLRAITGTQPAAGGEIAETVPTGARWELLSFRAALTTNAAAGVRSPIVAFDNGTTNYSRAPNPGTTGPGSANDYYWAQGVNGAVLIDGQTRLGTLPASPLLLAGFLLKTSTQFMAAGDQWTAPILLVREWLEVG